MIRARRPGDYARADLARIAESTRRTMREHAARVPVSFLYVAKRRRDARRERLARLAWCVLGSSLLPVLFLIATR